MAEGENYGTPIDDLLALGSVPRYGDIKDRPFSQRRRVSFSHNPSGTLQAPFEAALARGGFFLALAPAVAMTKNVFKSHPSSSPNHTRAAFVPTGTGDR